MSRLTKRNEDGSASWKDGAPFTSKFFIEAREKLCRYEEAAVWHDFDKELPDAYHEPYLVWVKTEEGETYMDVDVWNELTDGYGESCGFFECYGASPDTVLYWRETPEEPV